LAAANIVVNGSLYKKLSYDPVKDLAPVTQVYGYPNMLVVNNDVPVRSVEELVALARASPGKLAFGHAGLGTSLHLAGEIFKSMARIDIQDVPYRGSSLVAADLMGGRIAMSFIPPHSHSLTDTGGNDSRPRGDIPEACAVRPRCSDHGRVRVPRL
jgi:tripartite-type tricarboxylate transporter receptor subunit TctC